MLPDETLLESFSFLSHYGLNVAMIVSRKWKRIIDDFEFDERPHRYLLEWFDRYVLGKRARKHLLKAPKRLPHHIHIDGDVVRILDAREYYEDVVRHQLNLTDINAHDVRFSDVEFLELKASFKSDTKGLLLEGLLQKFPSLRTLRVAEIEYSFPEDDDSGITLRRLKEFSHLRELSIVPRKPWDEFRLSRADEDELFDLIEAFETIVGTTVVEVFYEHQPAILEEWLGIAKDYFVYGGPTSMKSKLVIKQGIEDHTAVWYKCLDSNVVFMHFKNRFMVSNDPIHLSDWISGLVEYSLGVKW
ncbi:hypothetical protein AAVH_00858 [Aphelenchoides avenae]|nr:hypothetical protein AAVH_00858 [Aphelenchus avenae]